LAFYYYWGYLDYPKALEEVGIAQKNLGNNSECYYAKGNIYRRAGEWSLAKENFLKAIELEPSSSLITFGLAETYSLTGEYQEAEKYFTKALVLNPTLIESVWQKGYMYLLWKGNTVQSRETITEAFQYRECSSDQRLIEFSAFLDICDHNYKKALSDLTSKNYDFVNYHLYYNTKYLLLARLYDLMDMREKAYSYYDSARVVIESRIKQRPDDPRLYSAAGYAYAGLGKKEKAVNAGMKAVELMPVNKEAYRGASRSEDLARIYVMSGEYGKAIELIDQLLKIPSRISVKILLLDPVWKPLWDLPEFKVIINKSN
jgi:serine/threonine-protein kinase